LGERARGGGGERRGRGGGLDRHTETGPASSTSASGTAKGKRGTVITSTAPMIPFSVFSPSSSFPLFDLLLVVV